MIVCGFLFFLGNAYELNSNYKNIQIEKTPPSLQNISKIKNIPNKSQLESDELINKFSKDLNKLKNTESIIIVKKGQTFSSILDNFNFENKKNLK